MSSIYRLAVNDEMLKPLLEGNTIEEAIKKKRLFLCDLEIMQGLPKRPDFELCCPIGLFFVNGNKRLVPIAIQLYQEPGPDNPDTMTIMMRLHKRRIAVLALLIVVTVVVVVVKMLPQYYPSTAATPEFKIRPLGYDCNTNHTDTRGAVTIPDSRTLSRMDHKELSCLYNSYITNLQYLCRVRERLGRLDDGGWDVCVDEGYRPTAPCLVLSFGINNDFTFDDAVNAKYGCEVHSYDPSMGQQDHIHAPQMYFHNTGLASFNGYSGDWRMRTLGYLRREIDGNKRRKIDILKMDIERMEWEVLPEAIKSESFRDVTQLCLEFHSLLYENEQFFYEPERDIYVKYLNVLQLLFQSGFRIFWSNKNLACMYSSRHGPQRTSCNEVYFVHTELLS